MLLECLHVVESQHVLALEVVAVGQPHLLWLLLCQCYFGPIHPLADVRRVCGQVLAAVQRHPAASQVMQISCVPRSCHDLLEVYTENDLCSLQFQWSKAAPGVSKILHDMFVCQGNAAWQQSLLRLLRPLLCAAATVAAEAKARSVGKIVTLPRVGVNSSWKYIVRNVCNSCVLLENTAYADFSLVARPISRLRVFAWARAARDNDQISITWRQAGSSGRVGWAGVGGGGGCFGWGCVKMPLQ